MIKMGIHGDFYYLPLKYSLAMEMSDALHLHVAIGVNLFFIIQTITEIM